MDESLIKKEMIMKKMLIMLGVAMPLCLVAQNSIQEGIARINSQRLSNVAQWLKDSNESENQMLLDFVMYKLDKLEAQVDALKEQLDKKLTPEMSREFNMLKGKINAQIEKIKAMTPEMKKAWRENLKFKFDQLPQEIMFLRNKLQSMLPEEVLEQFNELQEKAKGFVEWLRALPATDKEALRQILQEKVEKLQERVQVLNQLGRKLEYQEIKTKIDNFLESAKEWSSDVKDKAIDLYDRAIKALKGTTTR